MKKWKILKIMGLILMAISMFSTALVADTRLWFCIDSDAKSETLPSVLTDMVKGLFKLDRSGQFNIYRKQGGCPYTDSSEFTLECWLYWRGEGGNTPIWRNPTAVVWGNYDTAGLAILVHSTDGKIGIWRGSQNITTELKLPCNKWSHVAVVKNNTDGANTTVWLNGKKNEVISLPKQFKISDAFAIGGHDKVNFSKQYWSGKIREVRLSDKALTPKEFLSAPKLLKDMLLFYLPFEDKFQPTKAKDATAPEIKGCVSLVPDRHGGKAAKFSNKGDFLRYISAGNLNMHQGAISLWINDLDASPKMRVWNPYFQIKGENEVFNILRLWQPIQIGGGKWENGQKIFFIGANKKTPANTWYHLLFTWRKNQASIYLNGELATTTSDIDFVFTRLENMFTLGRPAKPTVFADDFHTGEHLLKDAPAKAAEMKIGKESYGAFLLDDIAIFNCYLFANEIKAIYEKPIAEALNTTIQSVSKLKVTNYPGSGKIKVSVDFGSKLPNDTKFLAEILKADSTLTGLHLPMELTPGGINDIFMDVKSLKPGKYWVVCKMLRNGKIIAQTEKKEFKRMAPEAWMTNTYGAEDVVLHGFEPLKTDGTTVKLWGRTIRFDNSLMPTQVTNQGKDMLAKPINWFIKSNGKTSTLKIDKVKIVSTSPTRFLLEVQGKLGKLDIRGKVKVEYDGFMKFDLTFDPGEYPVRVDHLWMDIPLVAKQATNLFYPTRRSGVWPGNWDDSLRLRYTGVMTLGTPDICLQWLTESDQHYFPRGDKKALQAFDQNGVHLFRTNVINAPKQIKKPFSLTFALHAGPVKARPKDWRGWTMRERKSLDPKLRTDVRRAYDWWARTAGSLIPRKGMPEKKNPDLLKNKIKMTSMHFAGFRHYTEKDLQKRLPEWEKYENEWEILPRKIDVRNKPGWNEQYVDPNSSWSQWHIYNCYRVFSRTGIRGLYYDDWLPPLSKNQVAGSGYLDDNGILRPTYPIFSQRETHRRVYAIVHKLRPHDGIVMIHTASSTLLPISSFSDVIYDGEIMIWVDKHPPNGDYFKTYNRDWFQTIFSCRQYGPIPAFHDVTLKLAKRSSGKNILTMHNQRKLWAMLMTHDIQILDAFTSGLENKLYSWLDRFGIADPQVKFYPYWDSKPAVKVLKNKDDSNAGNIWAVAYTRPGKALVIVVRDAPDNCNKTTTVKMKIDREKLGLPVGTLQSMNAENLPQKVKGKVTGDILSVPVKADDFTAVVISIEKK